MEHILLIGQKQLRLAATEKAHENIRKIAANILERRLELARHRHIHLMDHRHEVFAGSL